MKRILGFFLLASSLFGQTTPINVQKTSGTNAITAPIVIASPSATITTGGTLSLQGGVLSLSSGTVTGSAGIIPGSLLGGSGAPFLPLTGGTLSGTLSTSASEVLFATTPADGFSTINSPFLYFNTNAWSGTNSVLAQFGFVATGALSGGGVSTLNIFEGNGLNSLKFTFDSSGSLTVSNALYVAGASTFVGTETNSGWLNVTGSVSAANARFTGTLSNSATLLNAGILTSSYSPASLPNLWSLTFSVETAQNWFGVVDDQMATSAEINGLSLPLAVDTYGITSTSSDGNSFNFTANTSGFAVWGPKIWRIPTVAVFAQMDSVTTSSNSVISIGVNGESTSFWAYADYQPSTGSLSFEYNPGSGVVHTGTISVGANQTAPMLGVVGVGAIWNVWWQPDAASQPQVLITTSQSLDLTVPSTLAAIRPVMSGTFTGGTVAYKVHRLEAGYAKGNSVSNMNVVKWRDGQPVVKDGHLYYLVGTRQHPNIANNLFVSIYSQQCGIYEWDSNTNQTRCVADFSFNRGSNIYPESNGSMMVNDDGSCELLVPSWSTWTGGTGATGFTRIYKYHLPTFPRGAIALPPGTLLALPGDANGITDYDPDMLEPYGGLYTLAYSHRIESNGSYYPILATSPDMVTWTQLATYPSPTSGTQVEGNNLINWGGTIYEVPVDNVAANWPVYDLTMTLKGTIAIPIQGGNIHFCAFPTYRADGNMEMKCIAWNVAGYPGVNSLFPGSLIVTLRSTNTITGAAFPSLKNLQQ